MTNILLISDFEFDRSGFPTTGYTGIATTIGNELTKKGHKVIGAGFSYSRQEHQCLFGVTNIQTSNVPLMIHTLINGINLSRVIYVSDIPVIEHLLQGLAHFPNPPENFRTTGIFAVESDPLCLTWAMSLAGLHNRLVISQFGTEQVRGVGLPAEHYPVPLDLKTWKMRTLAERDQLKEALGLKDKYVIFVNADGNERKNISAVLEGLQIAVKTNPKLHLVLLTRKHFYLAWKFDDLLNQLDLQKYVSIIDRGIPQNNVWNLYAGANVFFNMSKCEGLGLPVLEAMAVGVPVVATDATAMHESLTGGRGLLLPPNYRWIDPFGNTNRYFVFPERIAEAMLKMSETPDHELDAQIKQARAYIEGRTVENAISVIERVL